MNPIWGSRDLLRIGLTIGHLLANRESNVELNINKERVKAGRSKDMRGVCDVCGVCVCGVCSMCGVRCVCGVWYKNYKHST